MMAYRQPLPYRLQLKVQPQHTSQGFIQIEASGVYTAQGSLPEAFIGAPIPMGQQPDRNLAPQGLASLTYQVYPHNGTLFSVTSTCQLQLPGGVEKVIELQMYQLGEPDRYC